MVKIAKNRPLLFQSSHAELLKCKCAIHWKNNSAVREVVKGSFFLSNVKLFARAANQSDFGEPLPKQLHREVGLTCNNKQHTQVRKQTKINFHSAYPTDGPSL